MRVTRESACPLDCPDNCSVEVTVEDGRVVALDGDRRNPVTDGYLCGKVRDFAQHLYHDLRLLHPLVRTGKKGAGTFEPVSWDEALERIATRIADVRERAGGEAILPLCYGGSNGRLTQDATDATFFRRLGSSRLMRTVCAAPTGAAAQCLYGKMPGIALPDYEHAELIVLWGVNPAASGIHLVPFVKRAQKRGAKLVVVDPRRTKLAKAADLHVAPRPGTDLPVALAMLAWLFEHGRADEAFLAEHACEVDELRRRVAPWSLERAAEVSGVPAATIEAFACLYADSSPAALRCGWGLERNRNGCSAVAAVLALPAVAGKFGVRGGGYTMSNGKAWDVNDAVDEPEPATRRVNMNHIGRVLTREAGLEPPVEVLFVYNNNPLATLPDQNRVRRGLERDDVFTIVFDQVLTDTARYADVVLPATTFLEHTEVSMGYASYSLQLAGPVIDPVGEARPNYEVFAELTRRLGLARQGDASDAQALVDHVVADSPRVAAAFRNGGVAFPETPAPLLFVDTFPLTPDGKIHLVPHELDEEARHGLYTYTPDPATDAHPLALISPATEKTISSTFGQLVEGPIPVALHPDDARARGLADGDSVRVFNDGGEVHTVLRVDPDQLAGVAHLPKGMWAFHTENGSTANALAPDSLTDAAGGACFNDARVEIERR